MLISPWLEVRIFSSPPEQANSSKMPEKSPGLALALGRFCVYYTTNPRDKYSLGHPLIAFKAAIPPAIAALLIPYSVAREKESPRDFEKSRPAVQSSQQLSTLANSSFALT